MIIFLDFDGVLHPEFVPGTTPGRYRANTAYFTCLPLFEEVLREFSDVHIVISSAWRASHSLDELRSLFSPDIAPRILGVTPQLPKSQGIRQLEIEAWIEQNNWKGRWLAIDDRPNLFNRDCTNVLFTETLIGLDASVVDQLRAGLLAAYPPEPRKNMIIDLAAPGDTV